MTTKLCIMGMHRSGTSLLAQMLSRCGVALATDQTSSGAYDNPTGYWEHFGFQRLNDRILTNLGGSWREAPAFKYGWQEKLSGDPEIVRQANALLAKASNDTAWGWKDPRNSLTFPFWKTIVPDLLPVVAVRNPIQVAMSLHERFWKSNPDFGMAFKNAIDLWLSYNRRILLNLERVQSPVVVTHYAELLNDPQGQIERICGLLDLSASKDSIRRAVDAVETAFQCNRISDSLLSHSLVPQGVIETYSRLCEQAGHEPSEPAYQSPLGGQDAALLLSKVAEISERAAEDTVRERSAGVGFRVAQPKATLDDAQIAIVHYRSVRATVASLRALFKAYPDIEITVVDNSGGLCPATDIVREHLAKFAACIRIIVNPGTRHGYDSELSHGSGLDLATKRCRRRYLITIETDTFVLERGCFEYLLSLMDAGFDWAGSGLKPLDGEFASISPSFAIFRVDLLQRYDLSFRWRKRGADERNPEDPLIRHHRLIAQRIREGAPIEYRQGKAPDTYRLNTETLAEREEQHEEYFDTAEWIHRALTDRGHKGYCFEPPTSICHTWGSRDDALFIRNFLECLPDRDLNEFLPQALHVKTDLLPIAVAQPDMSESALRSPESAWRWEIKAKSRPTKSGDDAVTRLDFKEGEHGYLILGNGYFEYPPPKTSGLFIEPDTLHRLLLDIDEFGDLSSEIIIIEYSNEERLETHSNRIFDYKGRKELYFLTRSNAERYRIAIRFTGKGSFCVKAVSLYGSTLSDSRN